MPSRAHSWPADKVEPGREAIEVVQVNNSMSHPARAYRRGHRALRDIASVDMTGQIDIDGKTGPLTIQLRRPNIVERTVRGQGLPTAYARKMAALFDFDGHLAGYRRKASDLDIRGMVKLGKNLAWRINVELADGDRWEMLIGNHGGNIIRWRLLDDDGKSEFEISPSDFRAVDGISFPFRTEYRYGDGALLAVETIAEIVIDAQQSTR